MKKTLVLFFAVCLAAGFLLGVNGLAQAMMGAGGMGGGGAMGGGAIGGGAMGGGAMGGGPGAMSGGDSGSMGTAGSHSMNGIMTGQGMTNSHSNRGPNESHTGYRYGNLYGQTEMAR